ncbi:18035_t:CDS:2, partial [Racocetra fulgida]
TKDTTKIRLVADRCWSLDDISLIDVKDADGFMNFIKILKHPTDQFIFQSSTAEEKKNLINMTKRATDEMMSAKAARHAELSFNDLREIEDLADQLVVYIATKEFDEAVESIEKAKAALTNISADATKLDSIRVKMEDRVVRLSYAISRDLTNPNVKKTQVQKCVKWLLRLGYGEQLREVGLDLKFLLDTLLQLDGSAINHSGVSEAANNSNDLSGLTEEEEDLLDSYGA